MSRYAFLYNPAAKRGQAESKIKDLQSRIESRSDTQLFFSQCVGDISRLIEQHFDDFDVFVACGGDGTIREVALQIINTDKSLGIIPMGTGNDLCKTLKIPINLDQSLDRVFNGAATPIDVGSCDDFIFLNTLGFGFDGLTNRYAHELNLPSILRYGIAALKAAFYQDAFEINITTDQQSYRKKAIMVTLANGRVEGGAFWIAPAASITDGKLNLIIIHPILKWLIPFILPLFLFKKPEWIPQYHQRKVEKLTLEFDKDVEIHADGEIIKINKDKFSISLINNGLKVL